MTDLQVEHLRDRLAVIAGAALEKLVSHGTMGAPAPEEAFKMTPPDISDELQERAAIMEFDGELSRDRAERAAFALVLRGRMKG